jgi:import receptor subunit TOM20
VQKAKEEEGKAAEQGQKERIKQAVIEANEDGFPRDPEETEGYFMQEVAKGEGMCQDGSDPVDAALCFYKALKVYPQPRELITIYDKTVPKVCLRRIAMDTIAFTDIPQPILDILAEMIAVDPSISVSSSTAGGDSANVE